MILNHIAIIVSSDAGVEFYKQFGYEEISRQIRPENHDSVVYLQGDNSTLEIYVDGTHPARVTNPEALGLRHLCFEVDDINNFLFEEPVKINSFGEKYSFLKDPDGLPIEIREIRNNTNIEK